MKLYKSLEMALKERNEVEALKVTLTGGRFPSELLMLTNLRELYLEGDVEDFPRIGSPWTKLRTLSMRWPRFHGDLSGVFSLPSLGILKILDTPLERLQLPLGRIAAPLKSLTLKSCGLSELPEEFSQFTSLEELNLSGNALKTLPHSFPLLLRLRRLNLDSNEFSRFPDLIRSMETLTHLSIDGNLFSEEEKARIQREFNIWPH